MTAPTTTNQIQVALAATKQIQAAALTATNQVQAAASVATNEVQGLIEKAKGLVNNQKYQGALNVVQQL